MSGSQRLAFFLLVILLPAGCIPSVPPPPELPPEMPEGSELTNQREKLALAFVTYTGELLKGSDEEVGRELAPCLIKELAAQRLLAGEWELVWGPAVYKFAEAELDDNMMFVVRAKSDPAHLVVAVRGTNGKAILDWLKEDLEVAETRPWDYGSPPPDLEPRISKSTHLGLGILQGLEPAEAVPGAGLTVRDFLAQQVAGSAAARVKLEVTGHSLGGALAPTLTLWLADTQEEWDPARKARLDVYAYAGPTAGNADFATYSDSVIGPATHRVHNPYDIVPKAWNVGTLEEIPTLYDPVAHFPEAVKLLLDVLILKVEDKDYAQIRPDQPPLPGKLFPDLTELAKQAGTQHTCGYLCDLRIADRFQPVMTDCQQPDPKRACPPCP